jgi:hypothetical protein
MTTPPRLDWARSFPAGLSTQDGTQLVMPNLDGNPGQLISTDGTGNLIFVDPSNSGANNVVYVTPAVGPNQYPNLTEALDAITTQSVSNQFCIVVYPGTYVEPWSVQLKSYVHIVGLDPGACIIECTVTTIHLLVGAPYATVQGLTLRNATGLAAALIAYSGGNVLADGSGVFGVRRMRFGECYTIFQARSIDGYNQTDLSECTVLSTCDPTVAFDIQSNNLNEIEATLSDVSWVTDIALVNNLTSYVFGSNIDTHIILNNFVAEIKGGPLLAGDGIQLQNGTKLTCNTVSLERFYRGLAIQNIVGDPVSISLSNFSASNCTLDLAIDKPGTFGSMRECQFSRQTSVIADPNNLAIEAYSANGTLTVAGILYQGETWNKSTLMDSQIQRASTVGLVSGGALTNVGLVVSASTGSGYVSVGVSPTDYIQFVEWTSTLSVAVAASDLTYLAIDSTGTLVTSMSQFNTDQNIALGAVYTSATDVLWFYRDQYEGNRLANRLAVALHDAFGSIVQTGLTTSESVGLPYELTVASGSYFIGDDNFSPTGGISVPFYAIYQDGLGGYTVVTPETITVLDSYDGGAGALVPVPGGQFAKHMFFIVNDGLDETYMLLYGQTLFATQQLAEDGDLPAVPNFLNTLNICPIAAPIVEGGAANISEILDIRPTVQFRSTGSSSNTFHGSLLGLANDDHLQYLLEDGTRAMSGDLDMGANAITNASTYNGVTVEAHASRHLPISGPDALTTAVPVTIGTANAIGGVDAFSRADHVHDHGAQTDPTQHAAATIVANGFMSSTDKTTLTNATPNATASTLVLRDGSAGAAFNIITSRSDNGLSLQNAGNTFSTSLKSASALASNLTFRLPSSNGTSGQYMSTDGAGNTSWITPSSLSNSDLAVSQTGPLLVAWQQGQVVVEGTVALIAASSSAVAPSVVNGIIYVGSDLTVHVTTGSAFPSVSIPLATYTTSGVAILTLVDKRSFLASAISLASATTIGLVNISSQSFAGLKTFTSGLASTSGQFTVSLTSPAISLSAASNQVVLNSASTSTTLTAPSTGTNRIYTLPDTGNAASSFIMADSAQTINGVKTFTSGIPITATSNQLVLSTIGTRTATISTSASGFAVSNRTFTLIDPGANANIVLDQGTFTMAGNYTFSNAIPITATSNQLQLTAAGTRIATITTAGSGWAISNRTLTLTDPGANANFVYDQGTFTMAGTYSFSNTITGNLLGNVTGNVTGNLTGSATQVGGITVTGTPAVGDILRATSTSAASWAADFVGDVVGPASSTSTAVVRFSGTTGKLLQNSGVLIDNLNNITGVNSIQTTAVSGASSLVIGALTTIEITATTSMAINSGTTLSITCGAANKVGVDLRAGRKMKLYGTDATPAVLLQFGEDSTIDTFPFLEIGSSGLSTWGTSGTAWDVGYGRTAAKTLSIFNSAFGTSDSILIVGTTALQGITTQTGNDITLNTKNLTNVGTINGITLSSAVIGPSSSTDNAVTRYDGITGKLVQDSVVIIGDTGNVTGLGTLNTRTIANWVDGPASATSTAIPTFNGTGGKTIQNSTLLLDSTGRLSGAVTLNSTSTITNVGTRCMIIACEASSTTAQIPQSAVRDSAIIAGFDCVISASGGATSHINNFIASSQGCLISSASSGNIFCSTVLSNAAGGAIQATGTSTINSCAAIGYNNTVTTVSAGGILSLNVLGADNSVNATGAINYCTVIGRAHTLNAGTQVCLIGSNHITAGTQTASTAIGSYISVNASGALGCGDNSTTTPMTLGTNAMSARYNGGYFFFTNTALTTGVQAGSGANAWSAISDVRKKENIHLVPNGSIYDLLKGIHVFNYNYKNDNTNSLQIGISANDLHAKFCTMESTNGLNILPLRQDKDGYYMVAGNDVTYLTLAAFQESQRRIEQQEARIYQLREELMECESRIQRLERIVAGLVVT